MKHRKRERFFEPSAERNTPANAGKSLRPRCDSALVGITPACAGKSENRDTADIHPWDHPRVCGEKPSVQPAKLYIQGSPPRVRGKACRLKSRGWRRRITPACAGKRVTDENGLPMTEDHPRVCGEKPPRRDRRPHTGGSPPRVRGKVLDYRVGADSGGITPACAGKRKSTAAPAPSRRDHPRVCGEKSARVGRSYRRQGSPPRVRGKGGAKLER